MSTISPVATVSPVLIALPLPVRVWCSTIVIMSDRGTCAIELSVEPSLTIMICLVVLISERSMERTCFNNGASVFSSLYTGIIIDTVCCVVKTHILCAVKSAFYISDTESSRFLYRTFVA